MPDASPFALFLAAALLLMLLGGGLVRRPRSGRR